MGFWSQVADDGLDRNWAFWFGLRRLSRGGVVGRGLDWSGLDSVRVVGSGPRVGLRLLRSII